VTPLVRVVVVTRDGGRLLERCLDQLAEIDWPPEKLDVVLVDNASTDGSVERATSAHPGARVLRAERNLGYAAGNNLALADLGDVEHVALLNNDAFVERDWLRPLVDALEREPDLGAVTSKVLLAPRYLEHRLEGPVTLRGVRVDGEDRWRDALFPEGWQDPDFDPEAGPPYRRSEGEATLWVPVSNKRRAELLIDDEWREVALAGEPFDVVNNVGSILLPRGHAADRGFLERDTGQFEVPEEVFAWSGTSVLLRREYLDEVGLFDPKLFAYYEDLDLAWRGRAQGWRYLYVPGSVVRHAHAATSVVGSELFDYHIERNRLLVFVKNAPTSYALGAVGESLRVTGLHMRRDVVRRLRAGERPTTTFLRRRGKALGGFVRRLPATLRERRRLQDKLPGEEVQRWLSPDGDR
jgi:GT2 family glycosyltransferase